jgi:glycosyltransferase involved in cell wall biosynthesis
MMLRHTLPLIENTPDADVVLQIVSADKFVPVEGKINVLFTMWEFLDVPKSYQESLAKADYVIVPCGFCRDIFKPFCKHTPIVCWEGVDPDMYQFKERTAAEKFRFLWVGAPNPRKGYQSILQVVEIAERFPAVEFYLKTTVKKITDEELSEAVKKHWSKIVDIEDGPEKV